MTDTDRRTQMTAASPLTAPMSLVDPGFEPFEAPAFDPLAGHRAHMERIDQERWLKDACSRAFDRPIDQVKRDLGLRKNAEARARRAAAKKATPPKPRQGD